MEALILDENGKAVLPQPSEILSRDREDAMGAYLMQFAAWGIGFPFPFIGLLASVIYYLTNKKNSRFTAFHSYQSMLFHAVISILFPAIIIWGIIALFSEKISLGSAFYVFVIFSVLCHLLFLIISIIACMNANKGKFYYIPLFGRMAFNKFYGAHAAEKQNAGEAIVNRPPQGF